MAEQERGAGSDFAETYGRHVDMVYQLCYLHLKNHADSEDATQTVFLKFLTAGKTFADNEHEKAWLIVTAKNHCKNCLRHWWQSRRTDMESLPETPYWEDGGPSEITEKLLALPEKVKIPLYLYYYQGYSVREIAQMLGGKESTIQSSLARGRELLRREVG
jgi:RNA polymerase sigma-70 factor (ECF subfamily)